MKNIHVLLVGESYLSLNCSYRDSAIGTEVRKPYWTYTKDWKHYMSVTDASVRPHNIYITSDEEIKEGDWVTNGLDIMIANLDGQPTMDDYHPWKKIILATDPQLIQDGVQAIDDEFLEWFVKNPSCEEVKVEITEISCIIPNFGDVDKYKIILPKEEFKQEKPKKIFDLPIATNLGNTLTETMKSVSQHEGGIKQGEINLPSFKQEVIKTEEDAKIFVETMENIPEPNDKLKKAFRDFSKQETLEEFAKRRFNEEKLNTYTAYNIEDAIKEGAKWQKEQDKNLYSEEDLEKAYKDGGRNEYDFINKYHCKARSSCDKWFEQFKKK